MSQIKRAKPSAAMIIAVLALVAALSGAAIADSGPTANTSKPAKKIAKNAKKKATKALKLAKAACQPERASAAGASCQQTGPAGSTGAQGPPGTNGADGTARAYGHVAEDGTLSQSKNASVSNPAGTGTYCITPAASAGIDVSQTPVIAVPDQDGGSSTAAETMVNVEATQGTGVFCPISAYRVLTAELDVSAVDDTFLDSDEPFFFMIP